jgi:hypothetical protein
MKTSVLITLIALFAAVIIISCEKNNNKDDNITITKERVTGFVQKGPFINGSSITVSELNSELVPTGRNFNSQILDNKGTFEIENVELSSQYIELKADGFYFNEILGESSSAQLTLYALSDLSDKTSLNINVLSNLEKTRVEYLISRQYSFEEAKKQAQSEILQIFSIDKPDIKSSELLDISKEGDDNAILLAISVILQGYRTEAELSEFLANISTDIREDGTLTSPTLGTYIINHAKILNLPKIRENIEKRYLDMGVITVIPDFEKYVNLFINNTEYEFTYLIEYPEFSDYGENILYIGKDSIDANKKYSMAANLPIGTSLKIIMKGGLWFYQVLPQGPVNWNVSVYNDVEKSQIFTSVESGKKCDLIIEFPHQYDIVIEYYENESTDPTRIKDLKIIGEMPPNDTIPYDTLSFL